MALDAFGLRAAPATPAERRDQALSFGDQRQIVYQALVAYLGDGATDDSGEVDIWIEDLAADWVVWYSYTTAGPGAGNWRMGYSIDDDNVVTFSGDPEAVVVQTTYVPAAQANGVKVRPALAPAVVDPEVRRELRSALRNVRETRNCPLDFEMREVASGTGGTDLVFTGFACITSDDDSAAYEMEDMLGPWMESVSVGAFAKTLREGADVAWLVNHEGMTLARTKSGTMKLSEVTFGSPTGLHVEARLDGANPFVVAARSAIERGDWDQMSMAFRTQRQEWSEDYDRRWINEVSLNHGDVSIVNFAANPHTAGTVALRAESTIHAERLCRAIADAYERREGKTLSAATMAVLTRALDLAADADTAVDELQPLLADLMGVPNPDAPESAADEGRSIAPVVPLVIPNRVAEARARLRNYRAA